MLTLNGCRFYEMSRQGSKLELASRFWIGVKKVISDWSRKALVMKKSVKIIGVVFLSCGGCMISPVFGACF